MMPGPGPQDYLRYVRTPPDQAAPLTKRLKPRHWAALDYAVGAIVAVILFASLRSNAGAVAVFPDGAVQHRILPLNGPVVLSFIAVAVVAVALRRRRPVLMLGVLLAGSVLVSLIVSPGSGVLVYFLPVGYVLYLVAATYDRKQVARYVIAAVLATLVADATLMEMIGHGLYVRSGLVSVALCVIIAWSAGYTVRQRRRYAVRLQDEAASKAVAQERLRIARELHDVVAHSMSVIAVQAGYGQYVIDSQPADARTALGAIQATSREALEEMRRMLGALRQADETDQREQAARAQDRSAVPGQPGTLAVPLSPAPADPPPLSPAPGLADLDRLLTRTASAGVRVELTRVGQPRELPASIDLSAYRIVQEALTNVVKHARTSSCQVLIGYGQDELVLEVTDNGAGLPELAGAGASRHAAGTGPGGALGVSGGLDAWQTSGSGAGFGGTGHGIIGMRERVSLLGGEFTAGPRPGHGFAVSAHIPLPAGTT